jgi:hypothetical protein
LKERASKGALIVLVFLYETPTLFTGIGGTVILIGIAWYMVVEQREKRITEQTKAAMAASITGQGISIYANR